jgi:hypothetical protein
MYWLEKRVAWNILEQVICLQLPPPLSTSLTSPFLWPHLYLPNYSLNEVVAHEIVWSGMSISYRVSTCDVIHDGSVLIYISFVKSADS